LQTSTLVYKNICISTFLSFGEAFPECSQRNKCDRVIQINSPANDLAPFSASYTYHYNSTIDFAQFRQPDTPHPSADGRARYRHTYDNRNQIKSATYNWWNGSSWQNPTSYDVSGISYDRDGNHSALTRRTDTASANTYSYAQGSNRLTSVTKNGGGIQ